MYTKYLSRDPRFLILLLLLQIMPNLCQIFSVNEEVPVGTSVGFVIDRGFHQKYNYYLEPRDSLFRFHDSKQTLVVTNSTIDKEQLCPYQERCLRTYDVMVNSTQADNNKPYLLTRINITINDINDHAPAFQSDEPIVVHISEAVSPGTTRQKLPPAEDMDHGQNGNVTYSFVASATSPSALTKFELGKYVVDDVTHMLLLIVIDKLDREIEDEYNLTIRAEDGGSPRRSATLEVKVKVLDHNDNAPQFERSNYTVRVDENGPAGSEIVTLRASDADSGDNARLKFTWSDETMRNFGNYFLIDSTSGRVMLKSSLDREEKEIFHLTAIASDHGRISLSSHTLLIVHVEDVNDNPPSISLRSVNGQSTDKFEIRENSKQGTAFGRLIVSDFDQGLNARVTCDVRPPSLFTLSLVKRSRQPPGELAEFDLLTTVSFDREISNHHEIVVTCSDDGSPQLTSTKNVRVDILDENDNSPVFEKNIYRVEIEENTEIGTKIFQLEARDADEGNNSKIFYQLESQQAKWKDMLKINENGEVIVTGNINCEENSQMMFIARAINSGEPLKIGEAGFELTVRDKDEHVPVFDRTSYEFLLHSETPEHFLIGQVNGFDNDCSTRFGKVIYRLEDTFGENVERFFYVEKNSGEIHSRVSLDESKTFKFSVIPGNPSGRWFPESRVEVKVKVAIDRGQSRFSVEAPVFHFPNATNNSVTILVGNENWTAVCQLQVANASLEKARKLKSGSTAIFRFAILSGNDEGLLSIDESTGWIRTTTTLNSAVQFLLNVSASISHNSKEYTTTTVLIVNINKQDAISSDRSSIAATILDHSVLIAILLASSAFLVVFCVTVFVIRCHLAKRKRRPRRYNCRLETVRAASNCSLNGRNHSGPEANAVSKEEQNHNNIVNSLQKFNRFVSFNVDDDFPCRITDSRLSCPFRDNCSLHKPFVSNDFDEMNYLNERDLYNLPAFSTQTTSLYSTQKSLPDENQFKSFKPLRVSPIDRPPSSSSSGLRHLSPSSFFPITCSSHLTPSLTGFNYVNNNSKDFGSPSDISYDHRQSESQNESQESSSSLRLQKLNLPVKVELRHEQVLQS